jgi:hypothetical protein
MRRVDAVDGSRAALGQREKIYATIGQSEYSAAALGIAGVLSLAEGFPVAGFRGARHFLAPTREGAVTVLSRVGDNRYVKIIIKDSLTGLYYSGNQTWCDKGLEAMDFGTFDTAASAVLEKQLESVNVVLRFEEPEQELAFPLGLYRAQPRTGPTKAMGGDRVVLDVGG